MYPLHSEIPLLIMYLTKLGGQNFLIKINAITSANSYTAFYPSYRSAWIGRSLDALFAG